MASFATNSMIIWFLFVSSFCHCAEVGNKHGNANGSNARAIEEIWKDIRELRHEIDTTNNRYRSLESALAQMSYSMNTMQKEINHVDDVSKNIWKPNFRVIKAAFIELRKKISFVVPVINV